jgi:hypothetical protein
MPMSQQRTIRSDYCSKTYVATEFAVSDASVGFLPIMYSCIDPTNYNTLWTKANLLKDIMSFQYPKQRPDWQQGNYFR